MNIQTIFGKVSGDICLTIQTYLTMFRVRHDEHSDNFRQGFGRFSSKISRKLAKILRGVTQLNFDKKAELDFDRKNKTGC
jgi:hypothetical protein